MNNESILRRAKNPALISLEEHDRIKSESTHDPIESTLNGIECPQCNSELYDNLKYGICTSMPPNVRVKCKNCGYNGFRRL